MLHRQLRKRARRYEQGLVAGADDGDDLDVNRLRDLTDFDYRYRFLDELPAFVRRRMMVAAAKMAWVKDSGEHGYFHKLIDNEIDWKSDISVIASIDQPWAEAITYCCIATKGHGKPRNSGRCHDHDLCRCCCWMDYGVKLKDSMGTDSRTFERAARRGLSFFAIHISVRDHAENARAEGRDIRKEDWDGTRPDGFYAMRYDPRPVRLFFDGSLDTDGIHTCVYVFRAAQLALKTAYKEDLLRGLKSKAETALSLMPIRGLPHLHAVANGPVDDPQHLADELKADVDRHLEEYADRMQRRLWASVRVFRLGSAEDLERAALYLEKVIPVGELTKAALAQDAARRPDGTWENDFLRDLELELASLHDLAYRLRAHYKRHGPEFKGITRRASRGNLRHGKKSILRETLEHAAYRNKKAKELKARRRKSRRKEP